MKVIAYTRPDGGVSIVHPAPQWRNDGESDEDFIARVMAKDVPPGATDVEVLDKTSLPDRTFRDAWAKAGRRVEVDMPKAREVHMGRIRAARDRRLAAADIEYMRADEIGDAEGKRAAAAKKQALRDIPQTFDLSAAETPAELAVMWPDDLDRL